MATKYVIILKLRLTIHFNFTIAVSVCVRVCSLCEVETERHFVHSGFLFTACLLANVQQVARCKNEENKVR